MKYNWYRFVGKFAVVPVFFFYLYFALKSKDFFFFRYANVRYPLGGLLPIEKTIFLQFPQLDIYTPKTIDIQPGQGIEKYYQDGGLGEVVICKPVDGLRGEGVALISSLKELEDYDKTIGVEYVMQEYIDYPYELGVFYRKNPNNGGSAITISRKEVCFIEGDGMLPIEKLLYHKNIILNTEDREDVIKKGYTLDHVLEKGKILILRIVHNHAKGAICFDMTRNLVTPANTKVFDNISATLGIEYGRYDIEVKSLEAFKLGKDFKMLEVNGITSEPLEIYDQRYSRGSAYKKWFTSWKQLYLISKHNKKLGKIPQEKNFGEALRVLWNNLGKL